MVAAIVFVGLLELGPPPAPVEPVPPTAQPTAKRDPNEDVEWPLNGAGSLILLGGQIKLLSAGLGVFGLFLGADGQWVTWVSLAPSALGGGLLVGGFHQLGKHHAAHRGDTMLRHVRPARRVGWSLIGVGAGLLLGSSIALSQWRFEPDSIETSSAPYDPAAFLTVGAVFAAAPLLIGAGASALTWSASYPRAVAGRVEVRPSVGGLSVRF